MSKTAAAEQEVAQGDQKPGPMSANVRKLIFEMSAEAVGTGLIVVLGVGTLLSSLISSSREGFWFVPLFFGFAVALAVYCTAEISGGHLNPAITLALAVWRRKEFPPWKLPFYWFAQFGGAMLGAAINLGMFEALLEVVEGRIPGLLGGAGVGWWESADRGERLSLFTALAFGEYYPNPIIFPNDWGRSGAPDSKMLESTPHAWLVEAWGTFVLMLVICCVTGRQRALGKSDEGLVAIATGFTVACLIAVYQPITQAGFNPARDFGPRFVAWLAGWGDVALPGPRDGFWVYLTAPLVGALVAVPFYEVLIGLGLPINPPADGTDKKLADMEQRIMVKMAAVQIPKPPTELPPIQFQEINEPDLAIQPVANHKPEAPVKHLIPIPDDPGVATNRALQKLDCPAQAGWFVNNGAGAGILCKCGGGSHKLSIDETVKIMEAQGFGKDDFLNFLNSEKGKWNGKRVNDMLKGYYDGQRPDVVAKKAGFQQKKADIEAKNKVTEEKFQEVADKHKEFVEKQTSINENYQNSCKAAKAEVEKCYVAYCVKVVKAVMSQELDESTSPAKATEAMKAAKKQNEERSKVWSEWQENLDVWSDVPGARTARPDLVAADKNLKAAEATTADLQKETEDLRAKIAQMSPDKKPLEEQLESMLSSYTSLLASFKGN